MSSNGPPKPNSQNQPKYVGGHNTKYRFTLLADGLLRYEWAPDGHFEDRPSSFAIQRNNTQTPDYKVKESANRLEIITSRFHLTYNKQPFSPQGLYVLVFEHTRSLWRYGYHKPWENLGGTVRTLDGVDGRTDLGLGILSEKGYTTIDDSSSMLFGDDGFVAERQEGEGRVDGYLFAYGHDYRDAIKAFYSISGSPPLLPRWALGNWWSRNYVYSATTYLELVDRFRDIGVPLSVGVLDMDWHIVEHPKVIEAKQTGWTGYSWNRELFPDPPAFIQELHKRKLVTALNDHPADGVHSFEDMYEKLAVAIGHDTSQKEPIEFDVTDRKFFDAYFNVLLASLEDDGADFWWIDWQQGEYSLLKGVDPLWMLNHYHFKHNAERFPDRHPIIFSRYAGPGSHRYPIGFSGDSIVSWKSLEFQPEFTATASNVGYGWWSHDIGGHMEGVKDEELTVRWIQLGVFSPIMRLHSVKSRWVSKEPWKLGQLAGGIVSDFLRLRHRLIPYLHTMNVRAAIEGEPLIQPMYWEYPYRDEAYRVRNQYLFGSQLIVIPITAPQDPVLKLANVKGWLPPGKWVDFFTGAVYDGNRDVWLSRSLDQYPVFAKEGSIVPLDIAQEPENGGGNPEGFEVVVTVGADAYFEILEEDESAPGGRPAEEIEWVRTTIKYTHATGTIEIHPGTSHGDPLLFNPRRWSVRLLGIFDTTKLKPILRANNSTPLIGNTTTVSVTNNGSVIDIGELPVGTTTTIELGGLANHKYDVTTNWSAPIEKIIDDAQVEYALKDTVWDLVSSRDKGVPTSVILNGLGTLGLSENLAIAISEYLVDGSS